MRIYEFFIFIKMARTEFLLDILIYIHVLMLHRNFELIPIKIRFFMNI